MPNISPLQIHVEGVVYLLQNINIHKATRPNNLLLAHFLNEVAEITPALTVIFQVSFNYLVFGSLLQLFQFLRNEATLTLAISGPFQLFAFVSNIGTYCTFTHITTLRNI